VAIIEGRFRDWLLVRRLATTFAGRITASLICRTKDYDEITERGRYPSGSDPFDP